MAAFCSSWGGIDRLPPPATVELRRNMPVRCRDAASHSELPAAQELGDAILLPNIIWSMAQCNCRRGTAEANGRQLALME